VIVGVQVCKVPIVGGHWPIARAQNPIDRQSAQKLWVVRWTVIDEQSVSTCVGKHVLDIRIKPQELRTTLEIEVIQQLRPKVVINLEVRVMIEGDKLDLRRRCGCNLLLPDRRLGAPLLYE